MNAGVGIHQSRPGFGAPGVDTPDVPTPGLQRLSDKTAESLVGQSNIPPATDPGASRISNVHGAPALAPVSDHFAPEQMMLLLQALKQKTQEGQLRTAKEGLGVTRLNLEQQHKNALGKLQESLDKSQSADAKSKISKIFSWAAKIGAVVGSLLAIGGLIAAGALSGGATAPLLALAVMGLISSSISLFSAIKQEMGGEPLDINIVANMACKALLTLVGVPEEKLEAASQIMAGSLAVITGAAVIDPQLYGSLASGVVLMSSGSENWAALTAATVTAASTIAIAVVMFIANPAGATDGIKSALNSAAQTAKLVQIGVAGTSAVMSGTAGVINGFVALDEHDAAIAQSDRQKFSALIAKLQALMEEDTEQITQIVKDIQQSMSQVSKVILEAGESRSQIAANIGPAMA